MLVEVVPVRYARTTISTGSGVHSLAISTFGSGTDSTWFGTMCAVFANQNAAAWFNTWPLRGSVPSTRSKALMRSVTTITRLPSAVL